MSSENWPKEWTSDNGQGLLCPYPCSSKALTPDLFFHANSWHVFQDQLASLRDFLWVCVASDTRRRASHVAEKCVQRIGTSMAAAKSQGWKTEQAVVVAACDLCGSASWEDLARRRDSRCTLCMVVRRLVGVNWRIWCSGRRCRRIGKV